MGSFQGGDGEIHRTFNRYLEEKYRNEISNNLTPTFKDTLNKNIYNLLNITNYTIRHTTTLCEHYSFHYLVICKLY